MKKLVNNFWMSLTGVLSILFAIFFYPTVSANCNFIQSVLITLLGIAVIWIVYFVRASILREYDNES